VTDEHTSEGGRDDRGVPYHAESTLSGAQVLKVTGDAYDYYQRAHNPSKLCLRLRAGALAILHLVGL